MLTSTQFGLFYVSRSNVLVSVQAVQGFWNPDPNFLINWSAAVGTRSLSTCLLPGVDSHNTSNINFAFLFYENSTGQVSALLQHQPNGTSPVQWIDITSQESRSLPDEFKQRDSDSDVGSTTLYESQSGVRLSTPFTCAANFSQNSMGALFHSPNTGFVEVIYTVDSTNGPPYFFSGMSCASSYPE